MPVLGSRGGASISGFGGLANLGYFIRKALRFRGLSVNAYLSKSIASTGDRQKQTYSLWFKRGALGVGAPLISAGVDNVNTDTLTFNSSDQLAFFTNGTSDSYLLTTQVFRDPAAWYHVVLAIDTTQATSSNRVKLYINGSQVTAFSTSTYPTQNYNLPKLNNSSYTQGIGTQGAQYWDGYMAEMYFIDGQQLTPSSFAKTDASTGQWIPIKYSGTYGTNGYYVNFKDATSTTTLGYDYSGNGKHFTLNNISVTSGITYDSMTDVPTLSGSASNYATWNPLVGSTGRTYSDGNLKYSYANNWQKPTYSTIGTTTTLIYCELTNQTTNVTEFAVIDSAFAAAFNGADTTNGSTTNTLRVSTNAVTFYAAVGSTASIYKNGSTVATGLTTAGNNDVIMMAFDPTTGKIWFGVNGTWHNSGNPATGTNPSYTWSGGTAPYFVAVGEENGGAATINFGQRPFAYTPPSGFKALNTYNIS